MRVVIAEDNDAVRRRRPSILGGPDVEVVGEAATGRDAVQMARDTRADIVIMDIKMPEMNGLDPTRLVLRSLPHTQVLILAMEDSQQLVREVQQAGTRGFPLKSDAGEDLVRAIRTLQKHQAFFPSKPKERYAMADMWSGWQLDLERLTPFAEEWKEGRVEDFVRNLLNSAAKKRQQRNALLELLEEVKSLHSANKQLLAFFDFEGACQSWSAENCKASDIELVLAALSEWRAQLLKHGASFPPPEPVTRTLAAMQTYILEAQAADATIRPCFGVLDAALSSGPSGREVGDVEAESAAEIAPAEPEPSPVGAATEVTFAAASADAAPATAVGEAEPAAADAAEPERATSEEASDCDSKMPVQSSPEELEADPSISSTLGQPGEPA